MQAIPRCHTLAAGTGKLGHRTQLSWKKEHHNQVFLKARHVFYTLLLLLSCSLHCCPLVAKPAPCSQIHHPGTSSHEFVPNDFSVTSGPRASKIPHEMLSKVLNPEDSWVGST